MSSDNIELVGETLYVYFVEYVKRFDDPRIKVELEEA